MKNSSFTALSKLVGSALVAGALLLSSGAAVAGGDPQTFVQQEHTKLAGLLKQPASAQRDSQVNQTLDTMVDYEELTRRAFGKPCPPGISGCKDWWSTYSADDQKLLVQKLRKLVEKNYRKNLVKTLDYDISYHGTKSTGVDETRVITEAKAKDKPREPPVRVDYVIVPNASSNRPSVVDIYTENSSLTKNYYSDFNRMMLNPAQGLAHVMKRLDEKGNAP